MLIGFFFLLKCLVFFLLVRNKPFNNADVISTSLAFNFWNLWILALLAGSFLQEDGHGGALVLSSSGQPFVCFCTTVPILGRGKGEATTGQLVFMELLYCAGKLPEVPVRFISSLCKSCKCVEWHADSCSAWLRSHFLIVLYRKCLEGRGGDMHIPRRKVELYIQYECWFWCLKLTRAWASHWQSQAACWHTYV